MKKSKPKMEMVTERAKASTYQIMQLIPNGIRYNWIKVKKALKDKLIKITHDEWELWLKGSNTYYKK